MGTNTRARVGGLFCAANPLAPHSPVLQSHADAFNDTRVPTLRFRNPRKGACGGLTRHCPWVRKVRNPIFAALMFCCVVAPAALLFSAPGTRVRASGVADGLPANSVGAIAMEKARAAAAKAKRTEHQLVNLMPAQCNTVGGSDGAFVSVVPYNKDDRGIHKWLPQVHEIPRARVNDSTLAYVRAKIKLMKPNTGHSFGGYSAVPILIRPNSVMCVLDEDAEVVALREVPGRLWGIHFLNSYLLAGITTNRDTSHMYDSDSHIILWDLRDGSLHDVKVFGCHHDFHYNSLRRSFFAIHQDMVELECSDENGQSMTGERPFGDKPLEVLQYNELRTKIQAQCVGNMMMRGGANPSIRPSNLMDPHGRGLRDDPRDLFGVGRDDPRDHLGRDPRDGREARIQSRFVPKQRPLLHDDIHEVDSTGKRIWDFNTLESILLNHTMERGLQTPTHFSASQVRGIFHRPDKKFSQSGVLFDAVHSNGIDYDSDNDLLLFSSRHLDTIYCVSRVTRKLLWAVGRMSALRHFNLKGEPIVSPVYGSHGVQYLGKDGQGRFQFVTFDNDLMNFDRCWEKFAPNGTSGGSEDAKKAAAAASSRGCNANHKTRLVQIAVDVARQEAREVWEWFREESNYARVVGGGARILPNGNVIGSFGRDTHRPIVEVDKRTGEIVWQIEVSMSFVYFVSRFGDRPGLRVDHCVTPKTTAFELHVWNSYPDSSATLGRLDVESTCPPCAGEDGHKLGSWDFHYRPKWIETAVGVDILGPRRYGGLIFRLWNEDGLSYTMLVNRTCSCASGDDEQKQTPMDMSKTSVDSNNDVEPPKVWRWVQVGKVSFGQSYTPSTHVLDVLNESGRKIIVNGETVTVQTHWWDQAPPLDPRLGEQEAGMEDKITEMRRRARESNIARRRQENEERLNKIREERARRRG